MADKRSFNNPQSSLRPLIESVIRTDQREQAKQCTLQLDALAPLLAEHRGEWHRKMGDNLPRFQLLDVPRELFVLVLRAAVRQGHKACASLVLAEELATPEECRAALGGAPILHTACARAHGPLAEWLVASGACAVNARDAEGTPPIVWAARSGKVGVVAALTRAGEGACEVNLPARRMILCRAERTFCVSMQGVENTVLRSLGDMRRKGRPRVSFLKLLRVYDNFNIITYFIIIIRDRSLQPPSSFLAN